jgi:hypothetical protein
VPASEAERRANGETDLVGGRRYLVALIGFTTGAALLVHILTHIAVMLAVVGVALVTVGAFSWAWCRLPPTARSALRQRLRAGAIAGLVATVAYDGTRLLLVWALPLGINPFEAVPIFGRLIMGESSALATLVGVGYHVANGVGFAVAFTVVFGPRAQVLPGIVYALALEATMLALYPGWLDIRAISEFTSVSVLGHIAYGGTMGWTAHRMFRAVPAGRLSETRAGS